MARVGIRRRRPGEAGYSKFGFLEEEGSAKSPSHLAPFNSHGLKIYVPRLSPGQLQHPSSFMKTPPRHDLVNAYSLASVAP